MGKKNNGLPKVQPYHPDGRTQRPADKDNESKKGGKDNNNSMKIKNPSSKGKGKGNKYKINAKLGAAARKNIKDTENAAKTLRNFKAPEMKVTEKTYTQNLPDRPSVPKLPTITTPGGNLNATKVAKPSGRSGTINSYSAPVSDYKNVYKNTKRTQFQKP